MKIVVVGDIHNDVLLIKRLKEIIKQEKPNYVVLLGDISNFGELRKGVLSDILKYINKNKVLFVPGNHETLDLIDFIKKVYGIQIFHKRYFNYGDFVLAGIGGGDILFFLISDSEIEDFLKRLSKKAGNKNIILFSHLPPKYVKTSLLDFGSKTLYNFIKYTNPRAIIHAHIHETGGLEELLNKTLILNASRSIFLLNLTKNQLTFKKLL